MSVPVRIEGLVHDYGQGPVLSIEACTLDGGRVHLAGPNGAGKTTLLRILATLVSPTRGEVTVDGYKLPGEAAGARAVLGFAGHAPSLHDALQVRQALAMHAELRGLDVQRVDDALDAWDLLDHERSRVASLSHGQRRRLDLARALLHEPRVLLLDEPTTGLDAESRRMLEERVDAVGPELLVVAAPDDAGLETSRRIDLSQGRLGEGPP